MLPIDTVFCAGALLRLFFCGLRGEFRELALYLLLRDLDFCLANLWQPGGLDCLGSAPMVSAFCAIAET